MYLDSAFTDALWTLLALPRVLRLYPEDHPRVHSLLLQLQEQVRLCGEGLRIELADEQLLVNGRGIDEPSTMRDRLVEALRWRGVASVNVGRDAGVDDLAALGGLLATSPEEVASRRVDGKEEDLTGDLRIVWESGHRAVASEPPPDESPTKLREGAEDGPSSVSEKDETEDEHAHDHEELPTGGEAAANWAMGGAVWDDIATEALRQRVAGMEPDVSWFLILCDLFLQAPSAADRNLRRNVLEKAVEHAGPSVGRLFESALKSVGAHPEARQEVLRAVLPTADEETIGLFATEIGNDPGDVRAFVGACLQRADAARIVVALVPALRALAWRRELTAALPALLDAEPELADELRALDCAYTEQILDQALATAEEVEL